MNCLSRILRAVCATVDLAAFNDWSSRGLAFPLWICLQRRGSGLVLDQADIEVPFVRRPRTERLEVAFLLRRVFDVGPNLDHQT